MKKGRFKYEPLTKETVSGIHGTWRGSFVDDDEKVVLDFKFSPDGTWSSKAFRPDMKNGHWYLAEGLIVLMEGKIEDEQTEPATLVIMRRGFFYVVNADAPAGLIGLVRAPGSGSAR